MLCTSFLKLFHNLTISSTMSNVFNNERSNLSNCLNTYDITCSIFEIFLCHTHHLLPSLVYSHATGLVVRTAGCRSWPRAEYPTIVSVQRVPPSRVGFDTERASAGSANLLLRLLTSSSYAHLKRRTLRRRWPSSSPFGLVTHRLATLASLALRCGYCG